MPAYLLDSGILIRHLRNRRGYHELLQRLSQDNDLVISAFSRVEVLRGMREHERERTYLLLDGLLTHPLDKDTADRAGELLRQWEARGISMSGPDVVIAASALQIGATLVTTNPRHFPMPELPLLAADDQGRVTLVL
ncbi:MAG TPA: PIN domain-containing protein, partial [Ardenticatenaceae bacterium]|nr:PIN domain-containing protein [Ardenticatenaceae bacterium]